LKHLLILFLSLFLGFIQESFALDYFSFQYKVEQNDTFASILKKFALDNSIINAKTPLVIKIRQYNPHVKDWADLEPNTLIDLFMSNDVMDLEKFKAFQQEKFNKTIEAQSLNEIKLLANNNPFFNSRNLKIFYGLKYLLVKQSKTFTEISFSSVENFYKINTELQHDNYKLLGTFESRQFSYERVGNFYTSSLNNYEISLGWQKYLMGLFLKDHPILKVSSSSIELIKESQIGFILGYDLLWTLEFNNPININLRVLGFIPFKVNSDRDDVTLNSSSGFGGGLNLDFSRSLFKSINYSLFYNWQNELDYNYNSRSVKFQAVSGKINTSSIEIKSSLGLGCNF